MVTFYYIIFSLILLFQYIHTAKKASKKISQNPLKIVSEHFKIFIVENRQTVEKKFKVNTSLENHSQNCLLNIFLKVIFQIENHSNLLA